MNSQQSVLDHLYIQNTVTKLYWAFDAHRLDILREEVFASNILVDYTALFGGDPNHRGREELIGIWRSLMDKIEASQHIITGILPHIEESPTSAGFQDPTRVSANVTAYLRKKSSDGRVLESRNGGRLELEVTKETDSQTMNPWRIAKMKAIPVWDEGGKEFWQAQ
ncbi:hypothetical protein ACLMJK_001732 [Lecanora helva]